MGHTDVVCDWLFRLDSNDLQFALAEVGDESSLPTEAIEQVFPE